MTPRIRAHPLSGARPRALRPLPHQDLTTGIRPGSPCTARPGPPLPPGLPGRERHPFSPLEPVEHLYEDGRMARSTEPIDLDEAALGPQPVRTARRAIDVDVWVPFQNGHHQRVRARAIAWNDRAVRIQWRDTEGLDHDLWVWAKAVTRRQKPLMQGPPATERPELIAYRGPR